MTHPYRTAFVIVSLWLAGLGAAAQFGKVSATYPQLVAHYADFPFGVTFLVSVVGMVGLILGIVAGLVVARIGERRAILGALLVGAGVSFLQSLLPPFPVMLAARIVEGASHLAIVVVGPVAIASIAGERWQGAAMTLWSSFFGVTYALLFLIAPYFDVAGPVELINQVSARVPKEWVYYCFNSEYLFYPFMESRSVVEMLAFHADERRDAMLTYVIDLYAKDLEKFPNAVSLDQAHFDRAGHYALVRWDPNTNSNKDRQ